MSSNSAKKKMGRPAIGHGAPITVRLQPVDLAELDAWIAELPDPKPSRPEAIRQIVRFALNVRRKDREMGRAQ